MLFLCYFRASENKQIKSFREYDDKHGIQAANYFSACYR